MVDDDQEERRLMSQEAAELSAPTTEPISDAMVPVPGYVVKQIMASMGGECCQPTMNFRQVVPPVGLSYMQQMWVDPLSGNKEWRNVPVVYGNYQDRSPI